MTPTSLVWCAKSTWDPAIRREHQLAVQAVTDGVDVTFIERPTDVRALRTVDPVRFSRSLRRPARIESGTGVEVLARGTVVPGHLNRVAAELDAALLSTVVGRLDVSGQTFVCQTPWQWTALRRVHGRRIFDYSDDWAALLPPGRRRFLLERLARITDEADEIVVVSSDLLRYFPGRQPHVIENGTSSDVLAQHPSSPPEALRMVYVGTLTERFDVSLVSEVMGRLPSWRLDLYGDCQYPRSGAQPNQELKDLLGRFDGRVQWHGRVPRATVGSVIDSARVCVIPNRPEQSRGQSSMKLFDYASRGRPIVAAVGVAPVGTARPPGLFEPTGVDEWITAIESAAGGSPDVAHAQLSWAGSQTWERRWAAWSQVALGRLRERSM